MTYHLSSHDDELTPLVGATIVSQLLPSTGGPTSTMLSLSSEQTVHYRLERKLSAGGMGITFLALRQAPDGQGLVVVKVSRPRLVRDFGPDAAIAALKETVALQRLNDRVPSTPFVVRLIDSGLLTVEQSGVTQALPWLAIEYVHGGPMGTTLTDRVARSLETTGAAFDGARAARAVDCLIQGLSAVHEVGIIHRDLKPDNVLCCGSDYDEIFKVADFGIARPQGIEATFDGGMIGTIGYAPPELLDAERTRMGPWTDVFSLAAVIFFLLTGEEFFPCRTLGEAMVCMQGSRRRSLLDTSGLAPDLRARELACKAIDGVLAIATSADPARRPQSIVALGGALAPWLRTVSWRFSAANRTELPATAHPVSGWTWMIRQQPFDDLVVRSVAWDADGTFLAATSQGLVFWDGTSVRWAHTEGLPSSTGIRFVRRLEAGRWLVACEGSTFAVYTREGVHEVTQTADWLKLELFHGDLNDLAIAAGVSDEGPVLLGLSGRRWVRPMPLPAAASIMSVARIEDTRWLIAGRAAAGGALAAIYSPLDFEITPIEPPAARALMACAADPVLGVGVLAGSDGAILWYENGHTSSEYLGNSVDISAAAMDSTGTGWIASAGRILMRKRSHDGASWVTVWRDPAATAPIVSLFADVGFVVAVTADGSVLEGACPLVDQRAP